MTIFQDLLWMPNFLWREIKILRQLFTSLSLLAKKGRCDHSQVRILIRLLYIIVTIMAMAMAMKWQLQFIFIIHHSHDCGPQVTISIHFIMHHCHTYFVNILLQKSQADIILIVKVGVASFQSWRNPKRKVTLVSCWWIRYCLSPKGLIEMWC